MDRENPLKQGCAAALTVRGTIANNDVNEAATNETIRVAAIHKKKIYVCNGWHGPYNIHIGRWCRNLSWHALNFITIENTRYSRSFPSDNWCSPLWRFLLSCRI